MSERENHGTERLAQAYNRMLERVRAAWQRAGQDVTLKQSLEHAKEKAAELGELSREEADRVADYLRRDLQDAAAHASRTGHNWADWLRFDLQLTETGLAELFREVVDQSRVELAQFEQRGQERYTGEITGAGRLECVACGEVLHFDKTGRVPPCPRCHGSVFRKSYGPEEE